MADRIASFLFDHALVMMPLIGLLAAIAVVFLVRRWPRHLLTRGLASLAILVALFVAVAASALLVAERTIRGVIRHRVTTLTFRTTDGAGPRHVADLRGKVVVVNFWATWCPPCREEMPDLNTLADRYGSRDVTVLTITDEDAGRIEQYRRKVPLRTTVATFESDRPSGAIATVAYQGRPTTVVLDRSGNVRHLFIGKQPYEKLRRAVEDAL